MRATRAALVGAVLLAGALTGGIARADGVRYLDPDFGFTVTTHQYGQALDSEGNPVSLMLDLYEPANDPEGSRAVIIWAHGGGFTGGSRTDLAIVYYAKQFARRGYVTASISYRVRPNVTIPDLIVGSLGGQLPGAMHDAMRDMQTAVRWFRTNSATLRTDPARISVGGISAGASMALETAFNPEDDGDESGISSAVSAAIPVSGGSDVRRIEMGAPPLAMFHGTHDTTAPYPFAVMTCAGTIALTNVCELTTYPGLGHNLNDRKEDITALTADFLCRRVVSCA